MKNFKVVLEVEIEGKNPMDAVQCVEDLVKEGLYYHVQDTETNVIYGVDKSEEDIDDVITIVNVYKPLIK